MIKMSLPTLLLSGACLAGDCYAADEETMDFSLDSAPVSQTPAPSKPLYASEIELGGGYNTEDSFKFGEYSGLQNRGGFVIGNLHIRQRADYDGDSTDYWQLDGRNLGLESRFLRGEYGQQGKLSLFFEYDQTPHYRWDDARTPFIISGNTLNLPFDWVPAVSTDGMTNLNASLRPVNIATERQKYRSGLSWQFNSYWAANIKYFHEKKDGFDVTSGIFGTTGGNPLSAILPRPIDYDTDDVNFELNYGDQTSQLSLRYHLSIFDNVDALTWQNPYSLRPPLLTAYPDQGRLAREPDNQAHKVSLNFGHRFNHTTRLTGAFSYGWMLQNQDFLPYTVNPNLSVTTPLPRNSLDAQANNLHGNLTFTARPFEKTDLKARYTYTERDNQTPIDTYTILRNDSEDQDTDPASALKRNNLPYGYRKHKTRFDLGYRLFTTAKVTAGYDFERINRDYAEVVNTDEHTGRIKLTANPYSFMNSRLEYAHSIRNGSDYRDNKLFIDSHTQTFLDTVNPDLRFANNPLLRKFQYSDRVRDKISGNLAIVPTDKLTFGLSGYFTHDNYDAVFGLSEQNRLSGTFDINYAFSNSLDLHAFYTQEYFLSRQNGFERRSAEAALPPLAPAGFWQLDNEDNVYTAGGGFNWIIIENKLDIGLDYLFSRAVTEIDPSTNLADAIPLPSINTDIHSLSFRGDYHLKDNLRLRLSYRYESFRTLDFARDNVLPDTMAQVISLGSSSPDYNAHVVGLSMIFNY
ncbi:MAG: MtrB/PioB family decaheme-associated outer membrane protein [Methylobacter sp.]|uniref:MtrB/PioB family decaheme-associated outer membrane protein n=1 Tax=Methylobacter sp. TaxID=2051955 RepID=UPI0025826B75|nr:MtrB/PioB family decaheme-associated outer membrane protein [Methylobacter sp.]MCL7421488.1 MtrB/PioB family decaheme-associated outer membrane protein [Methylobacter sp.]